MTVSAGGFSIGHDGANVGYICAGGVSYPAIWKLDETGDVSSIRYIKQNGTSGDPVADFTTWLWGACVIQRHTFRITTPLVAGNNVITHNLNALGPVMIDVRDATTGERIDVQLVAEAINATTINVIVAEPSVTVTITAVEG